MIRFLLCALFVHAILGKWQREEVEVNENYKGPGCATLLPYQEYFLYENNSSYPVSESEINGNPNYLWGGSQLRERIQVIDRNAIAEGGYVCVSGGGVGCFFANLRFEAKQNLFLASQAMNYVVGIFGLEDHEKAKAEEGRVQKDKDAKTDEGEDQEDKEESEEGGVKKDKKAEAEEEEKIEENRSSRHSMISHGGVGPNTPSHSTVWARLKCFVKTEGC